VSFASTNGAVMGRKETQSRNRRSLRLKGYDYRLAEGYFATICVKGGECLLGNVVEGEMVLSDLGRIVAEEWDATGNLREYVQLDAFVLMPNHLHGIIWLINETAVGATRASPLRAQHDQPRGPTSASLGAVIGGFKSASTRRINREKGTVGEVFWQRNYWERIIRNERELEAIRRYIWNNPANWKKDRLYVGGWRGTI
jgi:putative transposase